MGGVCMDVIEICMRVQIIQLKLSLYKCVSLWCVYQNALVNLLGVFICCVVNVLV